VAGIQAEGCQLVEAVVQSCCRRRYEPGVTRLAPGVSRPALDIEPPSPGKRAIEVNAGFQCLILIGVSVSVVHHLGEIESGITGAEPEKGIGGKALGNLKLPPGPFIAIRKMAVSRVTLIETPTSS
jgi:hypothetical protein